MWVNASSGNYLALPLGPTKTDVPTLAGRHRPYDPVSFDCLGLVPYPGAFCHPLGQWGLPAGSRYAKILVVTSMYRPRLVQLPLPTLKLLTTATLTPNLTRLKPSCTYRPPPQELVTNNPRPLGLALSCSRMIHAAHLSATRTPRTTSEGGNTTITRGHDESTRRFTAKGRPDASPRPAPPTTVVGRCWSSGHPVAGPGASPSPCPQP